MEIPRIQTRIQGGIHVRCARRMLPSICPRSSKDPTRCIHNPVRGSIERSPSPHLLLKPMALPPRPLARQSPRARPPPLPPAHNPPSLLHFLPTPNPPRPQRPNPPPLPLPAPNLPLPLPLLPPQTPSSHPPLPIPNPTLPIHPFTPPPAPHPTNNPPLRRPHPQHPHRLHRLLPLRRRLHHPPPRQQHHPDSDLSSFSIFPAAGAARRYERAY